MYTDMKPNLLTLGPAVAPAPGEESVNLMLWVFYRGEKGEIGRIGVLREKGSWGVTSDEVRNTVLKVKGTAKMLTVALEPVYDHNGYFDPSGGIFSEKEYPAHLKALAAKIGKLPAVFTKCPQCETVYTTPVSRCSRGCGYKE